MKLFGATPPRHDRTSPAPADVPTVDTLPADQPASGPVPAKPENGPAWGKARERTAWQYDELVRRPGLRVDRFVDLDSSMKLIEASVAGIEGAQ